MTTSDNSEAAAGAGNAEPPHLDRYPAEQPDGPGIQDAPASDSARLDGAGHNGAGLDGAGLDNAGANAAAAADHAVPDWGTPPTGGSDSPPGDSAVPAYGRPADPPRGPSDPLADPQTDPSAHDPAAEPGRWERVPHYARDRRQGGFGDPYEYQWRGGVEFRRRKPRTAAATAIAVISFVIFGIVAIAIFTSFANRANQPFGGSEFVDEGDGCFVVGKVYSEEEWEACGEERWEDEEFEVGEGVGDDDFDENGLEECDPDTSVEVEFEDGAVFENC